MGKKGLSEQEQDEAWGRRQNNINIVLEHITRTLESGVALDDVVSELTLRTENATENDRDSVRLLTMHASKGLEADHVFLLGVEQENFLRSEDYSTEDLAEEGRIFYVAMTRAKKQLYMTTAASRLINGEFRQNSELTFLDTIKPLLKIVNHDGLTEQNTNSDPADIQLKDEDWIALLDSTSSNQDQPLGKQSEIVPKVEDTSRKRRTYHI